MPSRLCTLTYSVNNLPGIYNTKSEIIDTHKAKLLTSAIQLDLLKYPRITLLERMAIDSIIDEIQLSLSSYADSSKSMNPKILPADLLLFLDIDKNENKKRDSEIIIRLFYTQGSKVLHVIIEKIKPFDLIGQRSKLSRSIIDKLKELYPLRGIISEINQNRISLNIGSDVGVSLDQHFKVKDHNIILKVYGIEKIKSYARPYQQEVLVKKGWKVELINEKNRK